MMIYRQYRYLSTHGDPRSGCQAHVARAMAPPKAPKLPLCRLFSDTCKISEFLHGVCMGRSGMSAIALYALFSHFCYVGGFGDLGDPVVRTLRGVSGDVVTVYTY